MGLTEERERMGSRGGGGGGGRKETAEIQQCHLLILDFRMSAPALLFNQWKRIKD